MPTASCDTDRNKDLAAARIFSSLSSASLSSHHLLLSPFQFLKYTGGQRLILSFCFNTWTGSDEQQTRPVTDSVTAVAAHALICNAHSPLAIGIDVSCQAKA